MSNHQLFLSDNSSGTHPAVMQKIAEIQNNHALPYGADTITTQVKKQFNQVFEKEVETFFVLTGTGANTIAIKGIVKSFHNVACSTEAHIAQDECGAIEHYCGVPLVLLPTEQGKIVIESLPSLLDTIGDIHRSQPKLISITQTTELGTLYTLEEIKAICDFAHKHELYVHMDGARLANAAAAMNVSFADLTTRCGIDVLSFGGTKNGLLCAEAIVCFNQKLAKYYKFIQKQSLHLISKMQFFSVQFAAYFENNLWLENAKHANTMATLLRKKITASIPEIKFSYPTQANMLFFTVPEKWRQGIEEIPLYMLSPSVPQSRIVTSFDTTEESINQLMKQLQALQTTT